MSNVTMSNVTKNSVWLKILSMLAEVVGCVSLYLGTGMLLVVPGGPGEPYLDRRMVAYGIAPTILSAILFLLAGWLWSRSGGPAGVRTYIRRAFQGALAMVTLFWVGLIVIAHLEGRIP